MVRDGFIGCMVGGLIPQSTVQDPCIIWLEAPWELTETECIQINPVPYTVMPTPLILKPLIP